MLSLKQIGTICFTTILSLFISPSYSYITNSSGCNQGVLQTDTGPAALEANYSANRINTTWYSDGTAIQGAPSYCMYDAAITLPSAQTKPGYTFGGWRLHVSNSGGSGGGNSEPETPSSPFASLDPTVSPSFYSASFDISVSSVCGYNDNNSIYDTSQDYPAIGDENVDNKCWCQLNVIHLATNETAESNYVYLAEEEPECLMYSSACDSYCESALANDADFRAAAYNTLSENY